MTKKQGTFSTGGRMAWAVNKFRNGDLQGDVYGLLEQVERCFPHWTGDMVVKTTARYLREARDNDTAEAILVLA